MARFLLILVSVGVLLNALTFLMVAHYFSGEKEAAVAAAPRSGPGPDAPPNPEILRKLSALESSISGLTKKVDTLANRPASQPSMVTQRPNRLRPQGGKTNLPGADGAAGGDDEAAVIEASPPPQKKGPPSRPAQPAPPPVQPTEPTEGEKQAPPADAPAGDGTGANPPPGGDAPAPDGTNPGGASPQG